MSREAHTQKIFGVTVHGDFATVVALGCMAATYRFGGETSSWAFAIAGAIAVHELAQVAALRAFRSVVPLELALHAARRRTASLLPWQTVLVGLAGPLACALAGLAVFSFFERAGDLAWSDLVERFGLACAVLAVVEVVPVLPVDGGVVLRALLEGLTRGRGDHFAPRTSLALAVLIAAVAAFTAPFEVTLCAAGCAVAAARAIWRERVAVREQSTVAWLAEADAAFGADDLVTARRAACDAIARTKNPELAAKAAELGAWIELAAGDERAARVRLGAMPDTSLPSALLRVTMRYLRGDASARPVLEEEFARIPAVTRVVPALAGCGRGDDAAELVMAGALEPEWLRGAAAWLFRARAYAASARVSQRAFERTNLADHAYNAACALAQARRPEEAVAWLTKAVDAGFTDVERARTDEDLAPLRADAAFTAAIMSLGGAHPYR